MSLNPNLKYWHFSLNLPWFCSDFNYKNSSINSEMQSCLICLSEPEPTRGTEAVIVTVVTVLVWWSSVHLFSPSLGLRVSPLWSRLWPAAACLVCWWTAVWLQLLVSSAGASDCPATSATSSYGGQTHPAKTHAHRVLYTPNVPEILKTLVNVPTVDSKSHEKQTLSTIQLQDKWLTDHGDHLKQFN